ncbi:unnamed protein product, partial [Didymodactylos carnosus]
KPHILEIAVGCVANSGWWKGLHDEKVTDLSNNEYSNHHVLPTTMSTIRNDDDIRRQERTRECKMITMCINEHEKLQLSNLVEAGELMYIDQKLDHVLDNIIQDYCFKHSFASFINACLIPIMYLLKRHQNLDNFTESLFFKYSQVESSLSAHKLTLRRILHILLLNSDLSYHERLCHC